MAEDGKKVRFVQIAVAQDGHMSNHKPVLLYALDDEGMVWLRSGDSWNQLNNHPVMPLPPEPVG